MALLLRLLVVLILLSELTRPCHSTKGKQKSKNSEGRRGDNEEICSPGTVAVQSLKQKVTSNGCSKPEFLTVDGEEDFTTCCDIHDACYATCGISKDHCEKDFKRCMQRMCKEIFTSNSKCESATETYVMGTTAFGGGGFETSQREFCQCVAPHEIYGHYEKAITHFYDSFVSPKDGEDKKDPAQILASSKYAKNHGTEEKPNYKDMPMLYYNLLKKYDTTAVSHIEKRKSNKNPPRLSKKETSKKSPIEGKSEL